MSNYYNINGSMSENDMENLFPEVYKEIYPFVLEATNDLRKRGVKLTEKIINSVVDNIIQMTGLWDEDTDSNVQLSMQPQFRRPRRRHHNRNSLRDIIRILLLREFLGRR